MSTHPLPYAWARAQRALLSLRAGQARLTVSPRTPAWALQEVRRCHGEAQIECVDDEALETLLTAAYTHSEDAASVMGVAENEIDLDRLLQDMPEVADLLEAQDDAPVIRMINALFTQAARDGASDIHLEAFESHSVVRYRVDGTLRDVVSPRRALHHALISRVKIMANLDIAEKRLPQDGRIALRVGGRPIDVRVSTLPTGHGERAVLRLLDKGPAACAWKRWAWRRRCWRGWTAWCASRTASCWSPGPRAAARPPRCTPRWRGWTRPPPTS